ncbi:MAG: hypothetical protein V5A38_04685 [Halolamina sp.]|uniref:DUF7853 family protein n=1 Tax=Halolamina sp. TaxID=1940283 RepID=UPI002FC31A78
MANPEHENGVTLELSEEEEWVLHAALLDHLDRQADGGTDEEPEAIPLLEQLEADDELVLVREHLALARDVLSEYLAGAPLRDRATCRSILSEIRENL